MYSSFSPKVGSYIYCFPQKEGQVKFHFSQIEGRVFIVFPKQRVIYSAFSPNRGLIKKSFSPKRGSDIFCFPQIEGNSCKSNDEKRKAFDDLYLIMNQSPQTNQFILAVPPKTVTPFPHLQRACMSDFSSTGI